MRKLNKNELININGGFKISGAILQYGRLFVLAFYGIGVGVGSAIRRFSKRNYCPIN